MGQVDGLWLYGDGDGDGGNRLIVAKHAVLELARINQAPDILLARLACVSFVNAQTEPREQEQKTEPETETERHRTRYQIPKTEPNRIGNRASVILHCIYVYI